MTDTITNKPSKSILNKEALEQAIQEYALEMGFRRADGQPKNISQTAERAIEASILRYLVADNKLIQTVTDYYKDKQIRYKDGNPRNYDIANLEVIDKV